MLQRIVLMPETQAHTNPNTLTIISDVTVAFTTILAQFGLSHGIGCCVGPLL